MTDGRWQSVEVIGCMSCWMMEDGREVDTTLYLFI
jgi:hypothetical protein